MNNEKPLKLPDLVIDDLKAQELENGVVPVSSLALFTKGDKVRVREGAFEGQNAIFEAMDDKERIQLLLSVLGRETKLVLPAFMIEAA